MQKLHALTTLRFFAAMGIVLYHVRGYYGVPAIDSFAVFSQGIAFFFILSGFILTYVYPKFETQEERKKFFIARLARIWPVHFLFFLGVGVLTLYKIIPDVGDWKGNIFNLLLVHAWIPVQSSYFALNGPSWSISTEFFFYLCFPFLVHNWARNWHIKMITVLGLPFLMMFIAAYFRLPDYSGSYAGISNHGLLYINPLSRIPEFIIGIFACYAWMKYRKWFEMGFMQATLVECAAVLAVFLNIFYYHYIVSLFDFLIPTYIHHEFHTWAGYGIFSCLSFAFLMMLFANGRGLLSKCFSFRVGVILGEISFSIYLLHQIIHRCYICNLSAFEKIPANFISISYWLFLFVGSYLTWKFVECPSRKWILSSYENRKRKTMVLAD